MFISSPKFLVCVSLLCNFLASYPLNFLLFLPVLLGLSPGETVHPSGSSMSKGSLVVMGYPLSSHHY